MRKPKIKSRANDTKGRANNIDVYVGSRIRQARVELAMSQSTLGQKLGVTFQQIQKYEKGVNRVGAGRLPMIAQQLKKPLPWFYEGAPGSAGSQYDPADDFMAQFASDTRGVEIARAFVGMPMLQKRALRDLIVAMSE